MYNILHFIYLYYSLDSLSFFLSVKYLYCDCENINTLTLLKFIWTLFLFVFMQEKSTEDLFVKSSIFYMSTYVDFLLSFKRWSDFHYIYSSMFYISTYVNLNKRSWKYQYQKYEIKFIDKLTSDQSTSFVNCLYFWHSICTWFHFFVA